jgi:hypothetical protein
MAIVNACQENVMNVLLNFFTEHVCKKNLGVCLVLLVAFLVWQFIKKVK